jgi:hypothetical protein
VDESLTYDGDNLRCHNKAHDHTGGATVEIVRTEGGDDGRWVLEAMPDLRGVPVASDRRGRRVDTVLIRGLALAVRL